MDERATTNAESESHRLRRELFPAGRAEAGLSAVMRNAGDPMSGEAVDGLNADWFNAFAEADDIVGHLQALLGPAALATFLVQWRNLRTAGEHLTMNLDMQAHVARARARAAEVNRDEWRAASSEAGELRFQLEVRTNENDEYREGVEVLSARHNEVLKTLAGWRKVGIVTERMQRLLARRIDAAAEKASTKARARRNQDAISIDG
jgi:hypothetical protein